MVQACIGAIGSAGRRDSAGATATGGSESADVAVFLFLTSSSMRLSVPATFLALLAGARAVTVYCAGDSTMALGGGGIPGQQGAIVLLRKVKT